MRGKPVEIVNRDAEWGTLAAAWGSTGPELVFVVGRRRAGKSYLLWHFARAAGGVYYQATERTESEQLAALSGIVGEHFNDAALRRVSLPDWESLFGYVTDKSAGGPFLLV